MKGISMSLLDQCVNRRQLFAKLSQLSLLALSPLVVFAQKPPYPEIKKTIPGTQEKLPVIGMGTYQTLDLPITSPQIKKQQEVLQAFLNCGGSVIDTSPMYGESEKSIGYLLKNIAHTQKIFAATKVWTEGKEQGIRQMQRSFELIGVKTMDLMQIHNLRDWRTHIKTLREWKEAGKIRYIGITTSFIAQYESFANIIKSEPLDFIQINYNLQVREAEKRLLPLAQEKNLAVIANMPFEKGRLFAQVKGKPLPAWAKEIQCESWAQLFLKFIISHPAVTCTIPATSKPRHMLDNMNAGFGQLADEAMRNKIIDAVKKA